VIAAATEGGHQVIVVQDDPGPGIWEPDTFDWEVHPRISAPPGGKDAFFHGRQGLGRARPYRGLWQGERRRRCRFLLRAQSLDARRKGFGLHV
jgi:hypothetical protein